MTGPASDLEVQFAAVLAARPRDPEAVRNMAMILCASGRAHEALAITTPLAGQSNNALILDAHAGALATAGRSDDAVRVRQRMVQATPRSVSAHHNLASILGDLGRNAEAETAVRQALALGGRATETWLVLGHALQGQGKVEEALEAYRSAIALRPDYHEAHADLAQLLWMQTEDFAAACEALDPAIRAYPGSTSLILTRSRLREFSGDARGAFEESEVAARFAPGDPAVQLAAAQQALAAKDFNAALRYSDRVNRIEGNDDRAGAPRVSALLALGRIEEAACEAEALHARKPNDQLRIGLMGTAWRMLGDPRYDELYDYDRFVRAWTIDTPKGWSSLGGYLSDLKAGLEAMHTARTHPVGQSLRHGSQTHENLLASTNPAVAAFPEAIDGPVRAHMAAIGRGEGPLRSRNTGAYAIAGIWSVRLKPNGFHVDHVHPAGWLSSACYIDLPPAVDAGGREGWIKFGEPGVDTLPKLEPQHFVKPEPGLLALFPSYMWHGTVPFSGEARRLTVAFDLLPKS